MQDGKRRITKFDMVRKCYVVLPEAPQGQAIQRLGMYEDRDDPKRNTYEDGNGGISNECGACGMPVSASDNFCCYCGQRLRRG